MWSSLETLKAAQNHGPAYLVLRVPCQLGPCRSDPQRLFPTTASMVLRQGDSEGVAASHWLTYQKLPANKRAVISSADLAACWYSVERKEQLSALV